MVSVVIPTYNRQHTLAKVLDSYMCQDGLKEIIFIDDGSDDGSQGYLRDLALVNPLIKVIRNDCNRGVSAARNQGIMAARGDYILFGEDDLYLKEDYTRVLAQCMVRHGADIAAGRIIYPRAGESESAAIARCDKISGPLINPWLMSGAYGKKIPGDTPVPFLHAISLVKAGLCRKLLFDERFFAREETDFYLRAVAQQHKVILCPHTYCVHLPRDNSKGGGWRVGFCAISY